MENYLNENFGGVKPKHSTDEVLQKWRATCGLFKNPKRRFRFTANIEKRNEAAVVRRCNHTFRVAVLVTKAALHLLHSAEANRDTTLPEEFKAAGFGISADDAGTIVDGHNPEKLKLHGGVDGLAAKLKTCTTNGLAMDDKELATRQELFGTNEFTEREQPGFWVFVWEALQDMTLMVLAVCAFVSLIFSIATEGWPKGFHDGFRSVASILLVVFATATCDYHQSLQFRDLDKEKKNISIQVTRKKYKQKLSMYELLPGDIVHLGIGDQVPADGLFLSGFALSIDKSSLTGESEPVKVNTENPYLLSGTKVQDGSCKMLVVAVGMRTQWGKLMASLTEDGNDETPLQVKLNGVATIIGKIGLIFAIVTFAVLVQKLFASRIIEGTQWSWSGDDALLLLEYFAIAVTIVVVAVPEGLPLAVTLSLAFAMKKMMNDKALVRNLAACETMGSATTICIQKIVQFQLTGNIVALIVHFTAACLIGSAPLTAVQLLWVNMIMDTLGALTLATKPPNERKGNFMWRSIFGQAVYQFAVIWLLQSKGKSFFGLDGDDSDLILNTLIFNCFVFCQLFNEVNSREMEKESVLAGILKNKVFVSVIAATVVFQVIITEYLGTFTKPSPLTPTQWLFSIFTGFLSMPIAVFLKKIPV